MNEGTNLAGAAAATAREKNLPGDAGTAPAPIEPGDRTFDRRPEFDERSRAFPILDHLLIHHGAEAAALVPRSYTWSAGEVLDQGREGACVGFGWSGELLARPSVVPGVDDASASRLYHAAQQVDEWPGDDYEGTSVLAGAKVVKAAGFMAEYRWAFSVDDVVLTLGYHGPVVIGVNWRSGMWDVDGDGYVHATGDVVGGHCVFLRAVNVKRRGVLIQNSWGSGWGVGGCAHLSWDDLGVLLDDDGDACVPVGRDRVGTLP